MKKYLIASIALIMVFSAAVPVFAQAATTSPVPTDTVPVGSSIPSQNDTQDTSQLAPSDSNFQIVSCTPTYDPNNPSVLKNDCTYSQLVLTAYRFVVLIMYLIIPVVVIMILYTGFKYMTAHGDANLVKDAKRMITPIVIGVFLIMAAWLIVHSILSYLLANQLGNWGGAITKSSIIGN